MITLRCALVWLAATTATLLMGCWLLAPAPAAGFEGLLLRTCSLALAVCLAWAWLATSAVVLDALRRRPRARRGVPAGLRRLVLAACGVALVAGGSPALATPGPVPLASVVGGVAGHVAATGGPVVVVPSRSADGVVVHAGDTLWSIAARRLPPGASDREVTDAWHRIYRKNRTVIGSNPDLVRPGQRLELPR